MKQTKTFIATLAFLVLLLSPIIVQAQFDDFENLEEVSDSGFFKNYIKDYFKGFWDDFKNAEPFAMNGGVGINTRLYNAWGIENRQSPYFWTVNTNINFQIYKFNIPFSALVSINQFDITAPNPDPQLPDIRQTLNNRFNRVGASPYYKWVKLHGGHRTMNFSEYTLSNLVYLGGGVDLTPGPLRISAMYGRLAQAEPLDLSLITPNVPVFQRLGWGTKIGVGNESDFVDLMLFKAWDDPNSIAITNPQEIFPNENVVIGIKAQKSLFEKFRLSFEVAKSALTADLSSPIAITNEFPFPTSLIESRENTTYKNAMNAAFDYQGSGFILGAKYRRIDPGYKSLGAYFFNNDIEDYTINSSFSLFEQSLQLSGSIGIQRDNLEQTKPSTLTRVIGSGNVNFTKNALNLGLTYSNFSSDIEYVLNPNLDSLNVVVVTQGLGLNAAYTISDSSQNQHSFVFTANRQEVTDDILDPQSSAASQMLNSNFVYSLSLASGWGFNVNANYNQNQLSMLTTNRWGAGAGISKSFLENKITTNLNLTYFKTTIPTNNLSNQTLNTRFGFNFQVNDSHSLNLGTVLMQRGKMDQSGVVENYTEVIGNIGYRFNFGYHPFAKKEKKDKKPKEEPQNEGGF